MTQYHQVNLITHHESSIKAIVNRFQSRCGGGAGRTPREDLLQEARLALLEYAQSNGGIAPNHIYWTVWHALYEAVRRDYPLTISYSGFCKKRRQLLYIVDDMVQFIDGQNAIEDLETEYALSQFIQGLNEMDQTIIRGKLAGMTSRDIARANGWSDVQVSRALHRMRNKCDALRYQI